MITAAAQFHLAFEAIHPFIDGNGRTGRLIMNFELIRHGFLPVDIKYTDRQKYYEAFDVYHASGKKESSLLEKMIVEYEIEELEKYLAILKGKGNY